MKKQAQSLIEYGLILALVAVVAVVILGKFSSSINKVGTQANSAVSASGTNAMCNYCKNTVDAASQASCLQAAGLSTGDCP